MSVDGMGGGGGASQRMAGPSPSRSPPTIGAGGRLEHTGVVLDAVLALMSHPPEPSPPPLLWTILICNKKQKWNTSHIKAARKYWFACFQLPQTVYLTNFDILTTRLKSLLLYIYRRYDISLFYHLNSHA